MNYQCTQIVGAIPRRLNLGCGYDVRPGWFNVDLVERHGPDLVADITTLPMLPTGWFNEIVACDVLEHIERAKTRHTLIEWARLLAPGGFIQIRVPSLLHLATWLLASENRSTDRANDIIHYLYGTQAYTGDFHLAGFTASTTQKVLKEAGLFAHKVTVYHGWLFEITARKTQPPGVVNWPEPPVPKNRLLALRTFIAQRCTMCKRLYRFVARRA